MVDQAPPLALEEIENLENAALEAAQCDGSVSVYPNTLASLCRMARMGYEDWESAYEFIRKERDALRGCLKDAEADGFKTKLERDALKLEVETSEKLLKASEEALAFETRAAAVLKLEVEALRGAIQFEIDDVSDTVPPGGFQRRRLLAALKGRSNG
jgi:hypothetical protein